MRAGVVAVLVGAAFLLSGCQYLLGLVGPLPQPVPIDGSFDPGLYPSFDPGAFESLEPDFSMPPPTATYTSGSATLTVAGATTTMERLSGPGFTYAEMGTQVSWTDGKGHFLTLYGTGEPGLPMGDGILSIDRIADGEHWATSNPEGCAVTLTQDDATGVIGTARCKGLRWSNVMTIPIGPGPSFIEAEPAFDAEISFHAVP